MLQGVVETWWSIQFISLDNISKKKKKTHHSLQRPTCTCTHKNTRRYPAPFSLTPPSLSSPSPHPHLRVEIIANSALQPRGALAKEVGQVLNVVAGGDAELADKVLCGALEVAVVVLGRVVFGPPKVCV